MYLIYIQRVLLGKISVIKIVILVQYRVNLQKREEHNCFDAQEFGQRLHWPEFHSIGLVEQNQAVHGHKLGHVVDHHHVREAHVGFEVPFSIYPRELEDN